MESGGGHGPEAFASKERRAALTSRRQICSNVSTRGEQKACHGLRAYIESKSDRVVCGGTCLGGLFQIGGSSARAAASTSARHAGDTARRRGDRRARGRGERISRGAAARAGDRHRAGD